MMNNLIQSSLITVSWEIAKLATIPEDAKVPDGNMEGTDNPKELGIVDAYCANFERAYGKLKRIFPCKGRSSLR
jgi:hypothetical protein